MELFQGNLTKGNVLHPRLTVVLVINGILDFVISGGELTVVDYPYLLNACVPAADCRLSGEQVLQDDLRDL
jgi:hypothetical protein